MKKKILCSIALLFLSISSAIAGIDFSQQDYDKALKGDKNLSETRLESADFSGKNLAGYVFTNADLEGANFVHADLEKTKFNGANLSNANFYHADLEEANLKGANIKGANFKNAELEYTTWTNGRICAEGSIGACW